MRWLNEYLSPGNLTVDEAVAALVEAGFPIEAREAIGDDVQLDVEITSNRGDCISHVGLAREIAAKTGRGFVEPVAKEPQAAGGKVGDYLKLENRTPEACPMFTARVIRGVKVGPSPAWLVRALEAVGQRSINNVVDVTNYLTFELGNPNHVFDLKKLAGGTLIVRYATEGEPLLTLDGKKRVLKAGELVVADAARPQSLAGVIGGGDSEVSPDTVDVVLEVATWDPVTIRKAARRLQIRTDAGYRFERVVSPLTLEFASRRGAELLLKVAGGQLCEGVLVAGKPAPTLRTIELRTARCREVLGFAVSDEAMVKSLASLGCKPALNAGVIRCEIPAVRNDLVKEIDLIEEVARTRGLGEIPIADKLPVVVKPPQIAQRAMREVGSVLTGMGFYETITFSFVTPGQGKAFVPAGLELVNVDDDRRGAEPTLRPSLIPSLLNCRKANQDGQVVREGGVRLFEVAAVFAQEASRKSVETRKIGLLADFGVTGKKPGLAERQAGVRLMRGAIESLVRALAGDAELGVVPASPHAGAFENDAYAKLTLGGKDLGYLAIVNASQLQAAGVETPLVAAEVSLDVLCSLYPPKAKAHALPSFPAVERDLSPIVPDGVTWDKVRTFVHSAKLPRLENVEFVGTYRGKQTGAGKKSLTFRLWFRDGAKTLKREEVDPELASLMGKMKAELGAEWRTA